MLKKRPKDFDITTSATPEQTRKLFRNCRIIGRRFRLVHVIFGREVIEVATFRGHHSAKMQCSRNGMLLRDNIYGSIEDDACRRDITINSLYYDPESLTVRDYVDGLSDLRRGVIRLIGNPKERYREDPVRMLRVVRFSSKLGMIIDKKKQLSQFLAS